MFWSICDWLRIRDWLNHAYWWYAQNGILHSCEAELVAADDAATKILWTKLFMEAQGYKIRWNILYQDNKSTILLLKNGKRSSGKRTRALNIRYFFLHDQQEKGNLVVKYCPTKDMVGDYMTKPKQGGDFRCLQHHVMGMLGYSCEVALSLAFSSLVFLRS